LKPLLVSQVNYQIKGLLDTTFVDTCVAGEVGNLTYASSGHIYFTIKDDSSSLGCVMFRGNATRLKFVLEVGLQIVIYGSITVYVPRGAYQLICKSIEPSGVGGLNLAYEQLKIKLQNMGYFDKSIKKPLPRFIDKLYLLTSNSGAVIEDMKKIATVRWPMVSIVLIPTTVQGDTARDDIVANITIADNLAVQDSKIGYKSVIVLARGGGSLEDLWCFNEETVATAIKDCQTPIASAIGHENDWTICDMVCDIRASTPSNAMEILLNDQNEHKQYLDEISHNINFCLKNNIQKYSQNLNHSKELLSSFSIKNKIATNQNNLNILKQYINQALWQTIYNKENELNNIVLNLANINPKDKKYDNIIKLTKNKQTTKLELLKVDDIIALQSNKLQVYSKVTSIKKF
jgi:exodeoxyribonuclease VII large subunit